MNNKVYFDHSATTPVLPEVVTEMSKCLTNGWGNPNSLYQTGRTARTLVETARAEVAADLGAKAKEMIFTGSGTEADNLAVRGIYQAYREHGNHIICFALEHPAVLETCRYLEKSGVEVT